MQSTGLTEDSMLTLLPYVLPTLMTPVLHRVSISIHYYCVLNIGTYVVHLWKYPSRTYSAITTHCSLFCFFADCLCVSVPVTQVKCHICTHRAGHTTLQHSETIISLGLMLPIVIIDLSCPETDGIYLANTTL